MAWAMPGAHGSAAVSQSQRTIPQFYAYEPKANTFAPNKIALVQTPQVGARKHAPHPRARVRTHAHTHVHAHALFGWRRSSRTFPRQTGSTTGSWCGPNSIAYLRLQP